MSRINNRKLKICVCKRCGYQWVPRVDNGQDPKRCAGCKTKYWDKDIEDKKQSDAAKAQHKERRRKQVKKGDKTPT